VRRLAMVKMKGCPADVVDCFFVRHPAFNSCFMAHIGFIGNSQIMRRIIIALLNSKNHLSSKDVLYFI
jgi:hypothetical protein